MRWRNGALSGSDLANESGMGSSRTYQPSEMPLPTKPRPGLRMMHQKMSSEAASTNSQMRAAVPPKRARVKEEVQTNETMQDLSEMEKELDRVTKTLLSVEEERDMWKRLFENCSKKQGEDIKRLRREYKEQSERLALTIAVERTIPARDIPRGQSPIELLTPREFSQTTNVRVPTATVRVPTATLGDPVVEQTVQKLIETAGRLVANRSASGSEVTAPYGTIDDTSRVELSQESMRKTGADTTTRPMKTSKVPDRKIREVTMKKVSRVFDIQKNNQVKEPFYRSSGHDYASMFQPIDVESSSKHAATAARDIIFDTE